MTHFFSVVICTYNRAKLLPRALDSLLAQSEQDWEAIVVDDGSTDHTKSVVANFSAFCPNIRLFQRANNRGPGAARNIGVKLSKGRYITFLDSDDEFAVDHLANRKQLLTLDEEILFLHGGVKIVGDPYVIDKDDPNKQIHLSQCGIGGTFFIRRDVFDEVGGFEDVGYAEDSRFLEKATAKGITSSFTPHPSYIYYRNVDNQLTQRWAAECKN